jgi:hypothetical protein
MHAKALSRGGRSNPVVQAKPTRSSTRRPATVKVARSPPEYTTFSWNSRMKPLSIFARKDTFGVEKLMLVDHKRRIERLEDQVKDLRDLLAIK